MERFVAIRRAPRAAQRLLASASVAERRASLVFGLPREEASALRKLGFLRLSDDERAPPAENAFVVLGRVGAYIVHATDSEAARQARAILADEYIIVPNVPLALPLPLVGPPRRLGRAPESRWPVASGVARAHSAGVRGTGVLVGVLDTGCDADHVQFAGRRIEFRYLPANPTADRLRAVRGFDIDGHGTHVCGIIAGRAVGVAPDVELLVASVIESEMIRTSLDRIVAALDWMLVQFQDPRNLTKPMIVNMSLGFRPEWIRPADLHVVVQGVRRLLQVLVEDFDVLPVIAIGNDGPGIVRAPGYFPEALSVGVADDQGSPWPLSGGGVSPIDGSTKPDLVGYGVEILSSLERSIDGRSLYAHMTGTSMAAPYVTGIAALVASANSGLNGRALHQRIIAMAQPLAAPADRVGAGLARYA